MRLALLTIDKREHERHYDVFQPTFGTAPEALLQGLAMLPEVEVHVVSCLQERVESPEKLATNIWYHGLHVPNLGWLKTGYQGCARAVRRKLRKIAPDVVHGQGTERDCAMSAVLSGYPNVLTIHGNMQIIASLSKARPLSFNWLAARLERFCLARTNGVICITDYTRRAVANQTAQTWTVHNAVDQSFFGVRRDRQEPQRILYVGQVCPRKNQNAFILAMDEVEGIEQTQIEFLGHKEPGDRYVAEFEALVERRAWCCYEGFADRERLKTYFSKATMLVLASLEDNCPMVVLEAMAAGVPVVASAVGGVPELIADGKNGLLCDPLEKDSMAAAVGRLLADSLLAERLAETAKNDALEQFHPRHIAQRHLEIYGGLTGAV